MVDIVFGHLAKQGMERPVACQDNPIDPGVSYLVAADGGAVVGPLNVDGVAAHLVECAVLHKAQAGPPQVERFPGVDPSLLLDHGADPLHPLTVVIIAGSRAGEGQTNQADPLGIAQAYQAIQHRHLDCLRIERRQVA